jgi:ParB family chromosome partitioning protein
MEDKVKKIARSGLGRGLAALISQQPMPVTVNSGNNSINLNQGTSISTNSNLQPVGGKLPSYSAQDLSNLPIENATVQYVSIEKITNNSAQPRQEFGEGEIVELAASIKKLGVLQPIVVRPSPKEQGKYEIVAGERRWRASKLAALTSVPVVIKSLDDREALEIGIVENVQRENLNPLELAKAYNRLAQEFSLSQEEIADRVGKDRATVSNILRILKLSPELHGYINESKLSLGHAKALLAIKDPKAQISLGKKAVNEQLSVRALEMLVNRVAVLDIGKARRLKKNQEQDVTDELRETNERLRRALATKVSIKKSRGEKGSITIEYFSNSELDRIVEKICL